MKLSTLPDISRPADQAAADWAWLEVGVRVVFVCPRPAAGYRFRQRAAAAGVLWFTGQLPCR